MINRINFGKRLSAHRKALLLSQAELADRLGVTSQAVSKWECGTAMPDIELLLELSHIYKVTINELLEERDLISELTDKGSVSAGIHYFVSEKEQDKEWADEIINGKWIRHNWDAIFSRTSFGDTVAEKIIEHSGNILEIGAGPGGGFMPYVLKKNREAHIIISDLSPTVVREWKKHLDIELNSPNIHYAAMNFCDIPFPDNCIDIVSDGGGIGNCIGDRRKALHEVYRILKPGGMLVTSTGFVNKETLSLLPEDVQRTLISKRPDIFVDLYEDTVLAGFGKIDSIIGGCWYTDDDDSTIADFARSLGVNLKFTSYVRYCIK